MRSALILLALATSAFAAAPYRGVNPEIASLLDEVSEDRIAATMKKLESFGTRDTNSDPDNPTKGIGAARRWIFEELKSYSPKLEVRFDSYKIKKVGSRIQRDLELVNVIAVLPGTSQKERHVLMSGHYDSLVLVRKPGASADDPEGVDWPASSAAPFAPGVSDDASGTAATMELARVMSRRTWKKTLMFVLFAGEEQGLIGSRLLSAKMKDEKQAIDAVLNSDIIGNDRSGNGESRTNAVRVFSADPSDSPSRALARYIAEIGQRYVPSFAADLVFRHDRFARGGDHTPFEAAGFPAVRFTTPVENYANQHSVTDTFANSSPGYTAKVAKLKLAVAANLAMAPKLPEVTRIRKNTSTGGQNVVPSLGRGKGYDAVLDWKHEAETDLAGYVVVLRKTTSPYWEQEIQAGTGSKFTLKNFSIDDVVLGVKAYDKEGFESPVATYVAVPTLSGKVELAQ